MKLTDVETQRKQERIVASDIAELARFAASMVVFILGALMVAEGVTKAVAGSALFFPELGPSFELVIGFIVMVLGASVMSMNRSRLLVAKR